MTQKYRKLTEKEILTLLAPFGVKSLKEDKLTQTYRNYVNKYYPEGAVSVVISLNSEYNDSAYDNSIQYVGVYDVMGEEIYPIKGKEKEARAAWKNLPFWENSNNWSNTQMDEIVIRLNNRFPDLYVLEKDDDR